MDRGTFPPRFPDLSFPPVGGEDIRQFHLPLGQRAGLVGKQDIHTPRRLDADRLFDEDVIAHHPPHIGGKNDGDHHGQPLGNGDHDHRDRERQGADQSGKKEARVGEQRPHPGEREPAPDDDRPEQVGERDHPGREVADPADLFGEPGEPEFQGAFPRFGLQFRREFTEDRRVADPSDPRDPLAAGHERP